MLIYAPQPDEEFAPVIGGFSDAQFALLENRLRSLKPAIRYQKELEQGIHPAAPQFTLKLHREDRDRAIAIVHEIMESIRSQLSRREAEDLEIAALVRQFTRAWHADDRIAADLMQCYLCREIQYFLERLLLRAKIEWAVNLWLDGISFQEVKVVREFELEVLGYVYIGTNQTREPFEASLVASTSDSALERFSARFGDHSRLLSAAVIRRDVCEAYSIAKSTYHVRVGSTVPRENGQLVEWAFEFVKL